VIMPLLMFMLVIGALMIRRERYGIGLASALVYISGTRLMQLGIAGAIVMMFLWWRSTVKLYSATTAATRGATRLLAIALPLIWIALVVSILLTLHGVFLLFNMFRATA